VSTSIAPDIHVLGNSTDLRRVLNNLVENARRYARTPGEDVTDIEIDCQVKATGHGRRAVLTLQDHGPGVPEDQIAQLLKPFTRLDTARGQANGAGLGLAIVERVLTRHNAELSLQNRPGGGLRIQITLPLAR
jgi:two-component system osmolarity sensor histidine kinase EnvZ